MPFPTATRFQQARPIMPAAGRDWALCRDSWYWLARAPVDLPPTGAVGLRIAADRHYWLFVNGQVALRYRQCVSADAMLFVQDWQEELAHLWRPGRNELTVLVRSDQVADKHHRSLAPLLICELTDAVGKVIAASGATWQVARLEHWRRRRAKATTRIYETITLPPAAQAWADSLPQASSWQAPHSFEDELPDLYAWTRRPARVDFPRPVGLAASGVAELPQQVHDFDFGSGVAIPLRLAGELVLERAQRLAIASESLRRHRLLVDGVEVARQDEEPGPWQQGLPPILTPLTQLDLPAGRHELSFIYTGTAPGWQRLRLGGSAALATIAWELDGGPLSPQTTDCLLAEAIGGKALIDAATSIWDGHALHLSGDDQRRSAVLDFGRPVNLRLSFRLRAEQPGRLYLAYGRWLHHGAVDCHRQGFNAVDILEVPAGESCFDAIDSRHLRYLDLLLDGCGTGLAIDRWQGDEETLIDCSHGQWRSDDRTLDAIVATSRRTAELCAESLFMDNPDREQAQWIDNLAPNVLTSLYWAADSRPAGKALWEVARHAADDGQLPGYAPGRWFPRLPLQCHMALYLQACVEYFFHTADAAAGELLLQTGAGVLAHWAQHRDAEGLLVDVHTVFVDWGSHCYSYGLVQDGQTPPRTGALTTLNAYYVLSLQGLARLAEACGRPALAVDWRRQAALTAASMRRRMFDAAGCHFVDGYGLAAAEATVSQTANALAVWAGVVDAATGADLLRRLFADPVPTGVVPANAHFAYQTLSAFFHVGLAQEACAWLRRGFGPMLPSGSLWESWEPYASPCQGTGSAPAALLARHLAGLYPAEPAYATIGLAPQAGPVQELHAVLPLPTGPVHIDWRRAADGGIDAELGLPRSWQGRPLRLADGVRCRLSFHG